MSSSSYQQRSPPHHDNGSPSAMNALYGYNTSPRRQQHLQAQGSRGEKGGDKSKKSSPFKDRFKLPNFSKLLDKAFGDDGRKMYQQYSHSTMSAPPEKKNVPRRTMSNSAAHSYSSQPHTHFGTSKRYSAGSGVPDRSLPDLPPGYRENGPGGPGGPGGRWSLCQCEPYPPGQDEMTLSPKTRRPAPPPPCPKPTPSPRYSIHRYPLGMHNSHDDVVGKFPFYVSFFSFFNIFSRTRKGVALTWPPSHISVTTSKRCKRNWSFIAGLHFQRTSKHNSNVSGFSVEKLLFVAGCSP